MLLDTLPGWLLRPLVELVNEWDWLGRKVNAAVINSVVNVCRHRPHPWSTVHDYVSWTSLTDQRWSARHLPAVDIPGLPAPEALAPLFQRRPGGQVFCRKSTCLFPSFAQYLTDSFIRTRMPNKSKHEDEDLRRQNTSNHQIDLCPLYGRTAAQTEALRLKSEKRGERGRLKTQRIGEEEFAPYLKDGGRTKNEFESLDEPLGIDNVADPDQLAHIFAFGGDRVNSAPQVAMMNTLFLREHNRIAGEIERRNEGWDDERVFQTARNIAIVLFIKIVVEEYINHIAPTPLRFRADPAVAWNAPWNKPNWITTEFSLLYRWHSLIPDTISWNGTDYAVGSTIMDNRPLIGAGLARAFADMSAQRAARLGHFNTAEALLGFEMLAIAQGRRCRVAPYADYRAYVGLPRPQRFEDVSADPSVVAFLKNVYKSPDQIEFYVGLFAEDTVENSPLPQLILRMVAVDAFSQALTNPLLSEHVFNKDTFTPFGLDMIESTHTLRDILARNSPTSLGNARISLTQAEWQYQW